MSGLNGTFMSSLPLSDYWSGYVHELPTSYLVLLGLVNIPVIAVVLNVLAQLMPKDPSLPPQVFHWIPYVGSAIGYGTRPTEFFYENQKKYGNVFTFVLFGRKVTAALGAQGNNFVLGGKSTVFNAEDAYTHLTTPVFGKDVVYDVPNEKFMEQKRFVKVGLSTENMRAYVGMIEDEVETFFRRDPAFKELNNNKGEWGRFDSLKAFSEITILTATTTLQGKQIRDKMDKTFADLYNDLDGGFTPLNFLFPNLPLESYRKRDVAHKKMSEFYVNIIKERRASGLDSHDRDMMSALMTQHYRDGSRIRDHEVAHMLIALLMAGQHTSSATGSWAICHLADNPDVAEALYQEQIKHFSTPDGKLRQFSFEELKALPLMDAVIRETLRVHPPIHSIMRHVRDDVPVPNTLASPSENSIYVVPKGHFVLASPYASQMDPTIWNESTKWDPSRWYDEDGMAAQAFKNYEDVDGEKIDFGFGAVSKGTESPYQPFGAGRHRCIGEQFAYLQIATVLATFVRTMEMRLVAKEFPALNFHTMIILPKHPRDIEFRRRKAL